MKILSPLVKSKFFYSVIYNISLLFRIKLTNKSDFELIFNNTDYTNSDFSSLQFIPSIILQQEVFKYVKLFVWIKSHIMHQNLWNYLSYRRTYAIVPWYRGSWEVVRGPSGNILFHYGLILLIVNFCNKVTRPLWYNFFLKFWWSVSYLIFCVQRQWS